MDERGLALVIVGATLALVGAFVVVAFRQFGLKYLTGPRREQVIGLPLGAVTANLPLFCGLREGQSGYLLVLAQENHPRIPEALAVLDDLAVTEGRALQITLVTSVSRTPTGEPERDDLIDVRVERPRFASRSSAWSHWPDDDAGLVFAHLGVPPGRPMPVVFLLDADRRVLAKGEIKEPNEVRIFLLKNLKSDLSMPNWDEIREEELPIPPEPEHVSQNPSGHLVEEVVKRYLDAFDRRDAAALAATFDPKGQLVVGNNRLAGRDAIEAFFANDMFNGDGGGFSTQNGAPTVVGKHVFLPVVISGGNSETALSLDFLVDADGIVLLRM